MPEAIVKPGTKAALRQNALFYSSLQSEIAVIASCTLMTHLMSKGIQKYKNLYAAP
jgi:hypothetical protein